eukprot:scaffold804_cov165-Amphora_coffeaeformis.AAC.25
MNARRQLFPQSLTVAFLSFTHIINEQLDAILHTAIKGYKTIHATDTGTFFAPICVTINLRLLQHCGAAITEKGDHDVEENGC